MQERDMSGNREMKPCEEGSEEQFVVVRRYTFAIALIQKVIEWSGAHNRGFNETTWTAGVIVIIIIVISTFRHHHFSVRLWLVCHASKICAVPVAATEAEACLTTTNTSKIRGGQSLSCLYDWCINSTLVVVWAYFIYWNITVLCVNFFHDGWHLFSISGRFVRLSPNSYSFSSQSLGSQGVAQRRADPASVSIINFCCCVYTCLYSWLMFIMSWSL